MPSSTHKINSETNTVVLNISIPVSEYFPLIEKKLQEYKSQVQVKGFRQGQAPMNLIKSRYGNAIISENVQELVNKELDSFMKTSTLDFLGSPMPINSYDTSIQNPKDISIEIEAGFVPEFEVSGLSSQVKLKFYEIDIDQSTLEKEILEQRKRLSTDFEENVESIMEEDMISVNIKETENNSVKQGGHSKDAVFIALSKTSENLKNKILNAKVSDKIHTLLSDIDKNLDENSAKKSFLDANQIENCGNEVELEIVEIKRPILRELNSDFYNQLFPNEAIESYDSFCDHLKKAIRESYNSAVYSMYNASIFETLMSQNDKIALPKEFLKRFLEQTQLKGENLSDDQFESLLKKVKWDVISNKLVQRFGITVSPQDVEYEIRMAIVKYYGFQISPFNNIFDSQVKKMMEDQETYRKYFENVLESKLFAALNSEFGKENIVVNTEDFNKIFEEFRNANN
jgi:trigger factor